MGWEKLGQSQNRLQREVEIPVSVLRLDGLGTCSVVLMESGEAHVVVKTQNSGLGVLGSGTSLRHLTSRQREGPACC